MSKCDEIQLLRKLPVGHALAIKEYKIAIDQNCSQNVVADAVFDTSEKCSNLYVLAMHYLYGRQQLEEANNEIALLKQREAVLMEAINVMKEMDEYLTRPEMMHTPKIVNTICSTSIFHENMKQAIAKIKEMK